MARGMFLLQSKRNHLHFASFCATWMIAARSAALRSSLTPRQHGAFSEFGIGLEGRPPFLKSLRHTQNSFPSFLPSFLVLFLFFTKSLVHSRPLSYRPCKRSLCFSPSISLNTYLSIPLKTKLPPTRLTSDASLGSLERPSAQCP